MTDLAPESAAVRRESLDEIMKRAAQHVMTADEIYQQKRSFVRGQIGMSNMGLPPSGISALVDKILPPMISLGEHERILSERIASITVDRNRWQQDSIEQTKAINRLVAAAEDRNIVDKNKEKFFQERIASAVRDARVKALEEAATVCDGLAASVLHPTQTITDRCAAAIRALITTTEKTTATQGTDK